MQKDKKNLKTIRKGSVDGYMLTDAQLQKLIEQLTVTVRPSKLKSDQSNNKHEYGKKSKDKK